MRKRPCLLFACIFLTGIAYQRYEWKALLLILFGFLAVEVYFAFHTRFFHTRLYNADFCKKLRRIAGRSTLLLSAFFLGMGHMKSQESFRDAYMSKLEDDSEAVVYGEIIKIEKTEYGSRLLLTDCYVSLSEAAVPCNKVMIYASSDHFRVGQIYQIKGQLHFFERARNEGNFDASVFYQSQKIDFFLYEKESVLLDSNENKIRDWILELKTHMEQVYKRSLDEEAAGFYMGMMLGDKSLLSDRTKDLFAVGGISHILAISGLHMSMIGRGCYKWLRKRRIGFLAAGIQAGLLLVAYCYMVGSGTSAIRAVGMMLIYFLAQYLGRSYDMLNSLGAVVIYLLWENPFLLEYSGFQFSITALFGVGFVGARLSEEKTHTSTVNAKDVSNETAVSKGANWKSSLWMSMGITLSTLPIVASCYYEIPLYSPFVNSLVLPMLSPIFMLALFGALVGCLIPAIGMVVLIPCGWLFSFYEFVCAFVEGLPFGSVITGKPRMEVIVGYYVVLMIGCFVLGRQKDDVLMDFDKNADTNVRINSNRRWNIFIRRSTFGKIALCIICFGLILWRETPKSEIIFLDVGQGDGIYVGSVDGTTCFIDGGSSDVNQVGTYRILPFLKARGVSHIDYWFVSHADTDHISGLLEVLEDGYEVGHVVISDKMPEDENKTKLLSGAEKANVMVLQMSAGDQIQTDFKGLGKRNSTEGIRIKCLYPWSNATDRNEQSMVLLLDFFDGQGISVFKALFSGDISSKGEAELIEKESLEDIDLYKAAHHGSKYSNSHELLQILNPKYCVISCSIDNSYGHPHVETIERLTEAGVQLLYTMENGQITFKVFYCTKHVSLVK